MEKTWDTFWKTGKVDDYLNLCRNTKDSTENKERNTKQNGTESCSDRDGLKCDADR